MTTRYVRFNVFEEYIDNKFRLLGDRLRDKMIRSQNGKTVLYSQDTSQDDGRYHLAILGLDSGNSDSSILVMLSPQYINDENVLVKKRISQKSLASLLIGNGKIKFSDVMRVV